MKRKLFAIANLAVALTLLVALALGQTAAPKAAPKATPAAIIPAPSSSAMFLRNITPKPPWRFYHRLTLIMQPRHTIPKHPEIIEAKPVARRSSYS